MYMHLNCMHKHLISILLFYYWILYFTDFDLCSFYLNVSVFIVTTVRSVENSISLIYMPSVYYGSDNQA